MSSTLRFQGSCELFVRVQFDECGPGYIVCTVLGSSVASASIESMEASDMPCRPLHHTLLHVPVIRGNAVHGLVVICIQPDGMVYLKPQWQHMGHALEPGDQLGLARVTYVFDRWG